MYAQVLREDATPDGCRALDEVIRDALLPSLRLQEGFCGAMHLVSTRDEEAMLIVFWETEQQARDAGTLAAFGALAPGASGQIRTAWIWEVTQRA
jgi:hypothetical protein